MRKFPEEFQVFESNYYGNAAVAARQPVDT
jgi:hypothetical protein